MLDEEWNLFEIPCYLVKFVLCKEFNQDYSGNLAFDLTSTLDVKNKRLKFEREYSLSNFSIYYLLPRFVFSCDLIMFH